MFQFILEIHWPKLAREDSLILRLKMTDLVGLEQFCAEGLTSMA